MQLVQSLLPVLIMQTGSLFITKKSRRARVSSVDWERFHICNTPHIKHDREDEAFHAKEKFDSVEFSRFALEYTQSVVTL